jgi:hypothetical protein
MPKPAMVALSCAIRLALAGFGQLVAGLAAIKQFCGKMPFQPVDTPDDCGMIDAQPPGSRGYRSAAHDGEHKTEGIPIDRYRHLDPAFPHIYGAISRTCIPGNAGQKGR